MIYIDVEGVVCELSAFFEVRRDPGGDLGFCVAEALVARLLGMDEE